MEATNQKIYCIINPDDKYTLEQDYAYKLADEIGKVGGSQANFLTPYELDDKKKNGEIVLKDNEAHQGDVIISLGQNSYAILRDKKSFQELLSEKVVAINHIAYLLGCTSFDAKNSISYKFDGTYNSTSNATVNANIPTDAGNIPVNFDDSEQLSVQTGNSIQGEVKLASKWKGKLTEDSYKEAIRFAKEYNLLNDLQIQTLIAQRNPQNPSYTKKRHYSINISSDLVLGVQMSNKIKLGVENIMDLHLNLSDDLKAEEHKIYNFEFDAEFAETEKEKDNTNAIGTNSNELPPIQPHQYDIQQIEKKCDESEHRLEDQKQLSDKIENIQIKLDKIHDEVNTLNINSKFFDEKIQHQSKYLAEQIASITETCHSTEQKANGLAKTVEEQKKEHEELRQTYEGKVLELSQRLIDIENNIKTEFNESVGAIQNKHEELKQEIEGKIHNLSEDFTRQLGASREELVQSISKSEANFKTSLVESEEKNSKQIELISSQTNQLNQKIESEHVVLSQMVIDSEAKIKAELSEIEKDFESKLDQVNGQIDQLDQKMGKIKSDLLDTLNSKIAECNQLIQNMEEQLQKQSKKQKIVFYATSATIGAVSIASIILALLHL